MGQDIDPFRAITISKRAHELKEEGRSILHMEFGQPSTPAPKAAIARSHEVLDTDPMGYWESQPLKARICQHYKDMYGVDLTPGRLAITNGASPALVLALATAFSPGDRIAFARPGYVAYRNTVRALNFEGVEIACGEDTRYQLSAAALDALDPAPQGVIIASPANPTGTIIPASELAAIADVAKAKGIRIISDEIYHGLSFGPEIHSMLEYAPDAFIVNSFSKYFSMAPWRLGWLVSPPDMARRTGAYIGNLFLTAPSLSQHAGLAAMDAREELDGHVEVYRRNRELMLEALPKLGLEKIAPPDGAFYVYADVSRYTDDSLAFCLKLLEETGVATAPGVDFDPVDGKHFMRFSFALSTPQIEEAIDRLVPWFSKL
ncbi:classes I and II aminotransferase [Hyphomonas adhaerens MHS-3]|uniref:aspartate transaminase n=1 Tax=Hyphomonas adhaerens MHS-3 TaxID=1280949 RepID=A0A069E628_9PROT|nr:aminotransferase class I/II-fold pyridoxal phosphate-dependent enzyme [Hyphomonas adhaerens]KCZ83028.1 classes I and II aminotransferase [Hyphomonas adhaerens MHS-3]|tara:strand:- start:2253 stop:3380 length:1128 start_codon:yes stop_codon:yes gene_type:complete